ncbi:type IX secretion system anionic LPS delivery protein PorZ [Flavobacterium humi]|uniref:ABC transporter substrate-binding protein n=1 Tax=Flavobacterium humi TaxID=2562683 RepID=A0A4Z0LB75_9FLAO|nr:two-component regulator propeller domain-containing protein [Flavobacterium humi]TGD58515.1 ABC transporter substrate-binding protein [Flavobacterium humi]
MKNVFLHSIVLLITFFGYSQEKQMWEGYFSYNTIKDISQSSTHLYAAAENAYFKKNSATNEVSKTTTIEGLSGENISQVYHSEAFKKTLIGHENGLLIVVNDTDGTMLNVVDIVNKPSVPQNKKRINHFMEHNGKVYIATDFGICVYDLAISEFGDTYFIGAGGANVEILQTTLFNGFIYAVASGYGLLKASVTNPNLIDYNQWTMVYAANWGSVQAVGTELIAIGFGAAMFKFVGDTPQYVTTFSQIPTDVRYSEGRLIITTQDFVHIYNGQLVKILQINNITGITAKLTCATMMGDTIYIGTQENGLFSTTLSNPTVFVDNTPNGPVKNKIFAIQSASNILWTVYGDYSRNYNPYPLDSYAISKMDADKNWKLFPYSDLLNAKSLTRIAVNPANQKQVYFSSYYSGLLKFDNDAAAKLYNRSNSTLQTIPNLAQDDIRVNGSAFDKNGNLWVTNSLVATGLHVLRSNEQWQSFALSGVQEPLTNSYGRIVIDKNSTKWIATNHEGVVGFNENHNNRSLSIKEGQDEGNLPDNDVRSIAVDNKNKLWIGTTHGLRVLPSVDSFLTNNELNSNAIIILEDGLAQELLYQQFITDIVVDGSDNKWIGTAGSGVFFISSDGQKTFNIFTKENSPLPSNVITDIEINSQTGEVFIATESGMVSYKGTSTKGAENLENIIAFPNPVRPEFNGSVAITGLMNKCNVKITDIEGNLVYEEISAGGTVMWDTKVFGKSKVASGVYMIFVSSEDGLLSKVKKVMIVR